MKDCVCKEATIEGLIMQLKLEREGNLALAKLAKREWVGLTVEEIDDIWKTEVFDVHYGIARMVEAKLKEKNT